MLLVKQSLKKAGVDSTKYAGHSFRIGVATPAAACGIQDSLINTLGRWETTAYQLYVRIPLTGVTQHLAVADK